MNKKSDKVNLQFFSDNAISHLEKELKAVIRGKYSIKEAFQLLEHASTDVHALFWHLTHQIGLVKRIIINNAHNIEVLNSPEVKRYILDDTPLDYNYDETNDRLGFTEPNPSDALDPADVVDKIYGKANDDKA